MDKAFENLFPVNLRQAVTTHISEQTAGFILLKMLDMDGGQGPISLDNPAAGLLHPGEKAAAGAYRLSKRRSEYITGRICAKLALERFWAGQGCRPAPATVEIANAASGRPLVNCPPLPEFANRPPPEISISHCGTYGAALATQTPGGIDLQEQKDTLFRVREKYCGVDENQVLQACLPEEAPLARLTLLWTAKEAAKKALSYWRMPGFLDLKLTLAAPRATGCFALVLSVRGFETHRLPEKITVLATTFDHYGLAVCILQETR
jgi:4'-phosphopantetheinyl transferase EntD